MKTLNSFLAVVYVVCFAPAMQVQANTLNDSSLTLLGAWTTGPCTAVSADREFVYLAKGSTLEILDVSVGLAPVPIGSLLGEADILQIAVSGKYAYLVREYLLGNSWYTLSIVDISSPRCPKEIATYELGGGMAFSWLHRICVSRDLLFVPVWSYSQDNPSGWYGWLRIVDVSEPTTPHEVGRTSAFVGGAARVHVSGQHAYVTTAHHFPNGGLHIFDIGNPADPQEIASFKTAGVPRDFAIEGNRLYVVSVSESLEVFDIVTPSLPRKIGACNLVGYPTGLPIVVSGEYVYATHDDTLSVIDVVDPASPRQIAKVAIGDTPLDVCKTSKCVYVAGERKGLHVFDITRPTLPAQCATYRTGSRAHDCAVSNSLAFVSQQDGLSIVDISAPSDPKTVGYFSPGIENPVIHIEGELAYLAGASPEWPDFPNYLVILNVADPSDVREVGRLDLGGYAGDVHVADGHAYVLLQGGGLKIVNVENPTEPAEVGSCQVLSEAQSIFVQGKYAYVVGDLGWGDGWWSISVPRLCIISIADPSKPMVYGLYDGLGTSYTDVYVEGTRAYVAGVSSASVIMDQGPPPVSFLDVVDVGSPSRPSAVSHFDSTENWERVSDLYVADGHIYCVTANGLQILDATDTSSIHKTAQFKAKGGRAVTLTNRRIVLLVQDGLYILQDTFPTDVGERGASPAAFVLMQNFPNPFNPSTTIRYGLPHKSQVSLMVYNTLGQQIAQLVNGVAEAGYHEVRFDASNLSSGVYFYRLRAGTYVQTRKLLLLR